VQTLQEEMVLMLRQHNLDLQSSEVCEAASQCDQSEYAADEQF